MGLRALEVEVLDSSGKHLATHPRAYGQASTNSEDPSMQLALLCNKPASWPNSRVRDALPDPLREWLDRQDRQTRNEALQTLKRVDRESGWANAVEAMLSILESTGGADRAGVTLLAARLAEGVAGIEYCVCSIESGPCERVDVFHVSGRFWSTSACGEKRTPARPAWTSFPS